MKRFILLYWGQSFVRKITMLLCIGSLRIKILVMATFLIFLASTAFSKMQIVDDFLIDQTEVTVGQFREFVNSTGHITGAEKSGGGLVYGLGWEQVAGWVWHSPYGTPAQENEPAVHVTFDDAKAFCEWRNKRLPRDNEWEKAAYTEFRTAPPFPFVKGNTYPFPTGVSPYGANCLNECGKTKVIDHGAKLYRGRGHALTGITRQGVNGLYDMGANVWEWTENGAARYKGTRGGSWWYGPSKMRSDNQTTKPRDMAVIYIGFRCVKNLPE